MLRGLLLAGWAMLATGCVLHVTNEAGSGGAHHVGGGGPAADGGGSSGADGDAETNPKECDDEMFTAGERKTIFDKARTNLEARGTPFDAELWSDETKFGEFVTEVYKVAGCSPPGGTTSQMPDSGTGTIRQPLLTDNGPIFYCGPGHGLAKLTLPRVSSCVNELCREHDACYSMCSGPAQGCGWNANTGPCDSPFVEQVGACPLEAGTVFASALVDFVATTLDVIVGTLFSCGTLACPPLGMLGSGVCSTQRDGTDCGECLAATDRGAICNEDSCSTAAATDIFCYPANCPEVSECFGGYGKGLPGTAVPPPPVANPDLMPWSIYVDRGVIPDTKANGDPWDVDVFGFGPPDPYVFVDVGTNRARTVTPQDTFKPYWGAQPALTSLTAADLRSGITFAVWDADFTFDDKVGTCTFAMADSDFNQPLLTATCDTPGLELHFYTLPTQ